MSSSNVVWFRQDLRLLDNPALYQAAKEKKPIIFLYILDDKIAGKWKMGAASRFWLHYSLQSLSDDLKKKGGKLILKKGDTLTILKELLKNCNINTIFCNRRYEPFAIREEKNVQELLTKEKISFKAYNGSLILDPTEISTKQGTPFKVFTPFWRSCLKTISINKPLPRPSFISKNNRIKSDDLKSFKLLPHHPDWATKIKKIWKPGEKYAQKMLKTFLKQASKYKEHRDIPSFHATSHLSPYLHFGEISPSQVFYEASLLQKKLTNKKAKESLTTFLSELGWREFSYHLLYHFPDFPEKPFNKYFEKFGWAKDLKKLKKWQQGKTGYPIVDAGMRELWQTGWMHNRVRMIVASFLTKDLLIKWQEGEKWFWDTLVDADLANNANGWQWTAGSGADAAPFFRVFNPVLQGEKFDPNGAYVKKWIPELKDLDSKYIHKPWEAPLEILQKAHVQVGKSYPKPVVDHQKAKDKALKLFKELKKD